MLRRGPFLLDAAAGAGSAALDLDFLLGAMVDGFESGDRYKRGTKKRQLRQVCVASSRQCA